MDDGGHMNDAHQYFDDPAVTRLMGMAEVSIGGSDRVIGLGLLVDPA